VKRSRLSGATLAIVALIAAMAASAAYGISTAVQGEMDFASCVSGTGGDGCTAVDNALNAPTALALSSDETRLFAVSNSTDAVSVMIRDKKAGSAMRPLPANKNPCITETGAGGTNGTVCQDGHGLVGPTNVAATGALAFVVTDGSDSIAAVTKDNASGSWKQLNNDTGHNLNYCLTAAGGVGTTTDGCAHPTQQAAALADAQSAVNFGVFVYVGGPGSIAAFQFNAKGALKQITGNGGADGCVNGGGTNGCAAAPLGAFGTVTNMWITRNGQTLYAVDGANVLVFSRNPQTGALTEIQSIAAPGGITGLTGVGADVANRATNVYVSGSNGIGVFARNLDGTLAAGSPQSCLNATGAGGCTAAPGLAQVGSLVGVVVYKTNRFVYAAGANGLASFARAKATGQLTPLATPAGCTTNTGSGGACLVAKGMAGLTDIQSTSTKHELVSGTAFNSVVAAHLGG
jgi:hypothetical protein